MSQERRISVMVGEERLDRMNRRIRYGLKTPIMNAVIDLVLDSIEREGEVIVGFILDGKYKLVRADED